MRDINALLTEAARIYNAEDKIQGDEIMYFAADLETAARENPQRVYFLISDIFDFGFAAGFRVCRRADRARAKADEKHYNVYNKRRKKR